MIIRNLNPLEVRKIPHSTKALSVIATFTRYGETTNYQISKIIGNNMILIINRMRPSFSSIRKREMKTTGIDARKKEKLRIITNVQKPKNLNFMYKIIP